MSDKPEFFKDFDEFKAPEISFWKLYRAEVEHENDLVHYRITWLFQSQGFLFAAFGLILNAWLKQEAKHSGYILPLVLGLISIFGIYLCICIQIGVSRAHRQLERLQTKYNKFRTEYQTTLTAHPHVPPLQLWRGRNLLGLFNIESIPASAATVWAILLFTCSFHLLAPYESSLSTNGAAIAGIIFAGVVALLGVAFLFHYLGAKSKNQELDDDESPKLEDEKNSQ